VPNRKASEFPSINGSEIDEEDLLTLVHVFEVDPTLRNKRITFTQFKSYLDLYYSPLSGATFSGNVTITGNFVVSGSSSFNTLTTSGLATLNRIILTTATTPASASATGTTGEIVWDVNYIYVCIATNTWRRTAINAW